MSPPAMEYSSSHSIVSISNVYPSVIAYIASAYWIDLNVTSVWLNALAPLTDALLSEFESADSSLLRH
jgi:hypothetical protein